MEDDKLRELFDSFQPELSSDAHFMSKLKRNMESVELVKRHTEAMRRGSRIAVIVAAIAGFVMGVALTLLSPLIGDFVSTTALTISDGIPDMHIDWRIVGWILTAIISVFTSVNAYEITVSRLSVSQKQSRICCNGGKVDGVKI